MLNELAHSTGVSDCLAKFAIDANSLRKMQSVYSYMQPAQFNETVKNRIQLENRGKPKGPSLDEMIASHGHGPPMRATEPTVDYTPLGTGAATAPGAFDQTHISGAPTAPGAAPKAPIGVQAGAPPGALDVTHISGAPTANPRAALFPTPGVRPSAPTNAGTVAGRANPLLPKITAQVPMPLKGQRS